MNITFLQTDLQKTNNNNRVNTRTKHNFDLPYIYAYDKTIIIKTLCKHFPTSTLANHHCISQSYEKNIVNTGQHDNGNMSIMSLKNTIKST
jgi:hypothetical protein